MNRIDTVFLDRDGVINKQLPGDYVKRWEEFEFLPGAKEALTLLSSAKIRLVVVTNQRGVARGVMSEAALTELHQLMQSELYAFGAVINGIFACIHHEGACTCRKPGIGLFMQAQERFPDIRFAESVMVGDALSDLVAGHRVGCQGYLITNHIHKAEIYADAAALGIPIFGSGQSLLEVVQVHLLPLHTSRATSKGRR